MLENTWREIDYRLDVLRATKGAHVEVYWCVVKKNLVLHFEEKKCLYSTCSSFLVINVYNQGKTLCSPCIFFGILWPNPTHDLPERNTFHDPIYIIWRQEDLSEMRSKMYFDLCVKYRWLFLSNFNETCIFSKCFRKILRYHENPSSGSRVVPWGGRTDMTKLIAAFRSFANAPEN